MKIKVIHVMVNGSADQPNIEKFEKLVESFVASVRDNAVPEPKVYTSVSAVPGTSAAWFTAIIQYSEAFKIGDDVGGAPV